MTFFTATINSWKHLLNDDEIKQILVNALDWMHQNNHASTHGFVLMPNHIHLLWSASGKYSPQKNELTLLRFTAHEFKKYLLQNNTNLLQEYLSTQSDREYHFWERRARTIDIANRKIAEQKLDYIHQNPLQEKWKLAEQQEDYFYSSAKFYLRNEGDLFFLTQNMDFV